MRAIYWFILGMRELRLSMTSHAGEFIDAYDRGREMAHVLTLRRFET